jgi:hypothetical protein
MLVGAFVAAQPVKKDTKKKEVHAILPELEIKWICATAGEA